MIVVSLISQKGGAGKTTIAINLAVAAMLAKKEVCIIDLDPQASSTQWGDQRENEYPVVVSTQASQIPKVLNTARESGADIVFIDTAPHSESTALSAARASDLVIIPCRPAILDLRAIGHTVDLSNLAKVPSLVLFNCAPHQGTLLDEANESIKGQYKTDICPITIHQRVSYVHSITSGLGVCEYEPKGKAAEETRKLYKYTYKHANMLANELEMV